MALTDESGMIMPVAPMNSAGSNGFGDWGSGSWWILLLFILLGNNGWGNGFGGNDNLYPWMNQAQLTAQGFDTAALTNSLNSIQSGVTSGFSDVQMALCNGFAGIEAGANARQIANMQQAFNAQTAVTSGMNDLAMGLQNCCCENRSNISDLKYTVATENCADRAAISDGIRDVIANQTANTQAILDKLCQQEIDALKAQNTTLQNQVLMKDLAASQTAQTAQLIADNTAQTQYVVNRVAPYPQPAYVVPNPSGCGSVCGGCGCA